MSKRKPNNGFARAERSYRARLEHGAGYLKSVEATPDDMFKVERLTEVIEVMYSDLRATATPFHLVASGWMAIPTDTTVDEAQAAKVSAAFGA